MIEVLMTRLAGWDRVPVAAPYLPIAWVSWDNLFEPGAKGRVRNDTTEYTLTLCWADHAKLSTVHAVKYDPEAPRLRKIFWIAEASACSRVSHFLELGWLGEKATFLARTWFRIWIIQHPGTPSRWSRSYLLGRLGLTVHAQNLRSHGFSCVIENKISEKKAQIVGDGTRAECSVRSTAKILHGVHALED